MEPPAFLRNSRRDVIQRFRKLWFHWVFGFHWSAKKMMVVSFLPVTFTNMVDCEPYVFVSGGATARNSLQKPAVATLLAFGAQPVKPDSTP
jgi:hypothetical protein